MLGGGLFNRDGGSREADGNGYQFNGSFSYAKALNDKLVVPADRRLLQLRPVLAPGGHGPARLPSPRRRPLPHGERRGRSGRRPDRRRHLSRRTRTAGRLRERRHQPAQVRPARRPGLHERRPADLRGRLLRHRRGSSTPASGRSGSRAARTWRTAAWPTRKGALRVSAFGNFLDAEAPNLLLSDPDTLGPDHPGLQDPDLRLRDRQHERAGREAHPDLRRQRCGRTTSTSRSRRATDRNEFGAYVQEEFFVDKFRLAVGGRVDKFGNLDDPVFSPARQRHVQAHARPLDPGVLQPRLRVAVRHQQLPGPEHPFPHADRPHAAQAAARPGGARSSRRPSS